MIMEQDLLICSDTMKNSREGILPSAKKRNERKRRRMY